MYDGVSILQKSSGKLIHWDHTNQRWVDATGNEIDTETT
jgi:hypothetical protein